MAITVKYYCDAEGDSPVQKWLKSLPKKIRAKGYTRILRLEEKGHLLCRPECDYLENDVYELRWRWQSIQYRILYFFHGNDAVILLHGFTKEQKIPESAIKLAVARKNKYLAEPSSHTYIN